MKDKIVVLGAFIIAILILVLIKSNEYFTTESPAPDIIAVNVFPEIKDAVSIALYNNDVFVLSTDQNGILYKITETPTDAPTDAPTDTPTDTPTNTLILTTELSSNLSVPQKIAFDSSGNIYIADSGHDIIYKFDTNTRAHIQSYTEFISPQGVALDSTRNIYISDAGANKLYYVQNGSTTKNEITYTYNGSTSSTFNNIRKVFVSSTDDIYILCDGLTSSTSYMVLKLGNKSNLGSPFPITSSSIIAKDLPSRPNSFTTDSSGNVYVLTNSSSISLYVPSRGQWILTNIPLSSALVSYHDGSDNTAITTAFTTGTCIFTDVILEKLRDLNTPEIITFLYITDSNSGIWIIGLRRIVDASVAAAPALADSQIAAANEAAARERDRLAAEAAEAAAAARRGPVRGRFDRFGRYVDGSGNVIPFQFDTQIMSKSYHVPSDYFKAVTKKYDQNKLFGAWSRY